MSIKKVQKINTKLCTNCYSPIYLKVNLSYFKNKNIEKIDKNLKKEYKTQLFNRLLDLSKESYLQLLSRRKNIGIEFEDIEKLNISVEIPNEFEKRFRNTDYNNKIAITRLCTNDNPYFARIIGIIINKIYYIFYLDINGTTYKH